MGAGRFPPGAYLSLAIPRRAVDPPDGRQRYDFTVVRDYCAACLFPSGVPRQKRRPQERGRSPLSAALASSMRIMRGGAPADRSVLGAEECLCPPAPPRVRAPAAPFADAPLGELPPVVRATGDMPSTWVIGEAGVNRPNGSASCLQLHQHSAGKPAAGLRKLGAHARLQWRI